MQNNIRRDLCQELSRLLEEWQALNLQVAATPRDFARLKGQIDSVCVLLEDLDKQGLSR